MTHCVHCWPGSGPIRWSASLGFGIAMFFSVLGANSNQRSCDLKVKVLRKLINNQHLIIIINIDTTSPPLSIDSLWLVCWSFTKNAWPWYLSN
jgi:hypothetical protein